ncbi:MAG: hypothetical protein ACRDL7_03575, partial [Gaiellaceae bacterium]
VFAKFRQEVVPLLQANTKVKDVTNAMASSSGILDVDKFNSSIKRDANVFPTFSGKQDDWFAFDRDLHAMSKMQQVERILDVEGTPPSDGSRDRALWDVQNAFLYSVLTTKVTKGQAAIYVRECNATSDAHKTYKRIYKHYNADSNRLALQVRYETKLNKLSWEYNYQGGPSKFLADFQQSVLDLESAKGRPLDNSEKKSKLCLAIKDRDYYGIRDIVASNPMILYSDAVNMIENQIMMISPPKTESRRVRQANRRGGRGGRGRRNGRNGRSGNRGGRGNQNGRSGDSNNWISDDEWRAMSKAAQAQKIADRLAQAEGIETRSIAATTTQNTDATTPSVSVLSLPPGLQPTSGNVVPNSGSVIQNMMSSNYANPNRSVNTLKTIRISSSSTGCSEQIALLDSGADTCLVGQDFYIEEESDEVVHVIGFQDHMKSKDMRIGNAITATETTSGETILLRANHVILAEKGNSLISTGQVEDYDHRVDARPRSKGGKQRLYLRDGYTLPLLHSGPHMYLKCRFPTASELS